MKIIWSILLVLAAYTAHAQKERKFVREGNTLFNNQDFEKAEVEYRKALDKEEASYEGAFNLGDALYKQKKYEEALQQFSALAQKETDKERLGELYHNLGNTLLELQKTGESIEAYKESLRNRPASEETKYNLEYARLKKQQQDQQEQQNKEQQDQNKDQQDQNKDREQPDQNKQDQEQSDQQKQDQQDQNRENPEQQEQQQPASKISKEDAQRLLEALQNDEKRVQEKVQKAKAEQQKAQRLKIEKDW
ncbi:MAG: tetratricopeptide repeat protein [Culturomica sp.]|jgi:tetratricopeptide (TPR) repeat protein|nr:tetratricopeptide repeat protein [Culturomica sp.]